MSEQFYNQTNITNFILVIPQDKVTTGFVLNAQNAEIPGINIPITMAPAQTQGLSTGAFPGSGFEFDPLNVTFLLDENMDAWVQMYKWMLATNNYIDRNQSGWMNNDLPRPVSLHILDNTKQNIILTINLYGCWCSALSPVSFDYRTTEDPAPTCVATLHFRNMTVEKDGSTVIGRVEDISATGKISGNIGVHPSLRIQ